MPAHTLNPNWACCDREDLVPRGAAFEFYLIKFVILTIVFWSRADLSFVLLGFHWSCFTAIWLVPNNFFFAEKIEHLSPLYAVARFNSQQQQQIFWDKVRILNDLFFYGFVSHERFQTAKVCMTIYLCMKVNKLAAAQSLPVNPSDRYPVYLPRPCISDIYIYNL